MKFNVHIEIEVQDLDADVMEMFPDLIQDRFRGSAIRVGKITVTKVTHDLRTIRENSPEEKPPGAKREQVPPVIWSAPSVY